MIRSALVAALLLSASAAMAQPAGPVGVDAAWARATTGGDTSAAYVTLSGHGTPASLIGVSTPDADMAMLHESTDDHGVSRMRDVATFDVPARGTAAMRPGGVHIMLMMLHHPLRSGDHLPLKLRFADGEEIETTAIVGGPGATVSPPR